MADTTSLPCSGFSHSPTISELAAALVKAQQDFGPAKSTRKNSFYSRPGSPAKYAPLQEVQRATLPKLQKHGLLLVQSPSVRSDGAMVVTTMIVHTKSGEWMRGDVAVIPDPSKGIQGVFSACTYARRYGLASMTQVMVEDDIDEGDHAPSQRDDDANAASEHIGPPQTPGGSLETEGHVAEEDIQGRATQMPQAQKGSRVRRFNENGVELCTKKQVGLFASLITKLQRDEHVVGKHLQNCYDSPDPQDIPFKDFSKVLDWLKDDEMYGLIKKSFDA